MTEQARKEVAELRAIARLLLEGLDKLERDVEVDDSAKPREPPPEAYAQVMARRRKRGG